MLRQAHRRQPTLQRRPAAAEAAAAITRERLGRHGCHVAQDSLRLVSARQQHARQVPSGRTTPRWSRQQAGRQAGYAAGRCKQKSQAGSRESILKQDASSAAPAREQASQHEGVDRQGIQVQQVMGMRQLYQWTGSSKLQPPASQRSVVMQACKAPRSGCDADVGTGTMSAEGLVVRGHISCIWSCWSRVL